MYLLILFLIWYDLAIVVGYVVVMVFVASLLTLVVWMFVVCACAEFVLVILCF